MNVYSTDAVQASFTLNGNALTLNALFNTGVALDVDIGTKTANCGVVLDVEKYTEVNSAVDNNACQTSRKIVKHAIVFAHDVMNVYTHNNKIIIYLASNLII